MADRREFGKGQVVRSVELQAALDALESADQSLAFDIGVLGVISGLVASEQGPLSSSVDVTPGYGYDGAGRRILNTGGAIDLFTDLNGVSTEVTTVGNERWVSLLVRYTRIESDQRVIAPPLGDGIPYYHEQLEGSEIIVRAGAEALAGAAVKPTAGANELILADSLLTFGQTQIINAGIDVTRRDDFAGFGGGGPHASTHLRGGGDEIDADRLAIDYAPANYTRTTAPAEVSDVTHLTAHLAGIDNALAAVGVSYQRVMLSSLQVVDGVESFASVSQFVFNPIVWAPGTTFQLEVVLYVNDGARTATAELYNLTDAEPVTFGFFSTSVTSPTKQGAFLTVGAAAGNLKNTETLYEIRLTNDGTLPNELSFLGSAYMLIY